VTLNYLPEQPLQPPHRTRLVVQAMRHGWALVCTAMPLVAQAQALDLRMTPQWSPQSQAALRQAPQGLQVPPMAPATQQGTATPWIQLLSWGSERAASNRAADAGIMVAQAQSRQTWATAWMPRLDASASTYQQKQTYNGLDLSVPTSSYVLSATLPLWRAAERASAHTQEAYVEQARWSARSNRMVVAKALSQAYISSVEGAELQRLARAQYQLLQELLQLNERRLQGGAGTVLEVLETRARLDQARASLQELETRLMAQRLQIERLVNQPVKLPMGFSPLVAPWPVVVPPQTQAQSALAQRNPQLLEAQSSIQAAQLALKARQAEAWQPTVDAVAQTNRSRQVQRFEGVTERQDTSTQLIGLQLNWPLFSGGVQQGRTQEGAALLSQAMARQDELVGQLEASLREAYQTLRQTQASIEVQGDVEKSATAIFDATRKAFNAGIRSNQELLNAQQEIYTARQSLVTARAAALAAQVDILAMLDQLDATSVAPLTAMFDTTALQDPAP
jgi:outer membrane protein TolC